MTPEQIFARQMCGLRIRLRASQADLARHVGVHQTVISKIERGERSVRLDEAYAIAAALRTTVDVLAGETR